MLIAVLFDGAGLARLGLEQAGHTCIGVELDPWKHRLSTMLGSGSCWCADVRSVDLSGFDAVWASPPCQRISVARTEGEPESPYTEDLLTWALGLPHPVLWVENVLSDHNDWGHLYNAAQFKRLQNRNRIIGGRFRHPAGLTPYERNVRGVCPTIMATEYKGCATDPRRASRFYGRRLTLDECAYHQGLEIPWTWRLAPHDWLGTQATWNQNLYHAIGNGVPVFMARAFGECYES